MAHEGSLAEDTLLGIVSFKIRACHDSMYLEASSVVGRPQFRWSCPPCINKASAILLRDHAPAVPSADKLRGNGVAKFVRWAGTL
jgi:hypothetical protein